jgi:predicted metal-binding protein
MAKVTLKWKLVSKNFDELKEELGEEIVTTMNIGNNHCKACVLSSGLMCIKREVCRIPENEVWINKEITVKKKKGE